MDDLTRVLTHVTQPDDSPDGFSAKSSVCGLSPPNKRPLESADDYPRVVVMLDAKTRVIECADGIQWIIQRRQGKQWRSEMFFRSKEGLLFYAPKPTAPELLTLPDWFPE